MRRSPLLWAGALAACLAPCAGGRPAGAASVLLALRETGGASVGEAVLAAFPLDPVALPPPAAATMDQKGRKYVPHILPIQTHARVAFANSDNLSHHVYSFSPAKRFQLFLTRGQPAQTIVFDQPGVVTLGCNLHDWMLGYIVVLDTPYFAQTDERGRATLSSLPAGRYRLEVWHPRITDRPPRLQRAIALEPGGQETWELLLEQAMLPARDQRPGFADY